MIRMRCRGAGFALIDAMIAILIVGTGLLVLAATQIKLTRSADVARQQGEAAKLAQQKLEELRSFTAISSGAGVYAWNDLANGSDNATTNAQYTRKWTITDIGVVAAGQPPPMRFVDVQIAWTDRSGAAQQLALDSVISRTDPSDIGSLGFPLPANTTLKRPKNRNINIPVPAVDLGGGQSVIQLANNFAVVFSNDSGYVVKTCNFVVDPTSDLSKCATVNAYIVAGYISLDAAAVFPGALGIDTTLLAGAATTNCVLYAAYDQNKSVDTNGNGIIDANEQVLIPGYKYYLCVIGVANQGATWSGKLRLSGMPNNINNLVCRFQYPAASGVSDNERNVQPYANVGMSIDNQNYVISSAANCPTISSLATTLHQDCRASNPNRATDCP